MSIESSSGSVRYEYPRYTNQELDEFGRWLDKFRVEKEVTWKGETKTIRPINLEEAEVAFGSMSKRMHAGVPTYAIIMEVMEHDSQGRTRYKLPCKHDLFQHKYNAWSDRESKREYAEKKRVEDYQQMTAGLAEEMTYEGTDDGNEEA